MTKKNKNVALLAAIALLINLSLLIVSQRTHCLDPLQEARCLNCIRNVTNLLGIDLTKRCEGYYCGQYQLSYSYWIEAGKPGNSVQGSRDFEKCARDKSCAEQAVKAYFKKFKRDCNNDGLIDCHDMAALHKAGPASCNSDWFYKSRYWQAFNRTICATNRDHPNENIRIELEEQNKQPIKEMMKNQSLTSDCLDCICDAVSGCNTSVNNCGSGAVCGPFAISQTYWKDGRKPGASWTACARTKECSMVTVKNYMEKNKRDCNGDGLITCEDYAAIHRRGPRACINRDLFKDHYWNKFQACRANQKPNKDVNMVKVYEDSDDISSSTSSPASSSPSPLSSPLASQVDDNGIVEHTMEPSTHSSIIMTPAMMSSTQSSTISTTTTIATTSAPTTSATTTTTPRPAMTVSMIDSFQPLAHEQQQHQYHHDRNQNLNQNHHHHQYQYQYQPHQQHQQQNDLSDQVANLHTFNTNPSSHNIVDPIMDSSIQIDANTAAAAAAAATTTTTTITSTTIATTSQTLPSSTVRRIEILSPTVASVVEAFPQPQTMLPPEMEYSNVAGSPFDFDKSTSFDRVATGIFANPDFTKSYPPMPDILMTSQDKPSEQQPMIASSPSDALSFGNPQQIYSLAQQGSKQPSPQRLSGSNNPPPLRGPPPQQQSQLAISQSINNINNNRLISGETMNQRLKGQQQQQQQQQQQSMHNQKNNIDQHQQQLVDRASGQLGTDLSGSILSQSIWGPESMNISNLFDRGANESSRIASECLECICDASSNCDSTVQCISKQREKNRCGLYMISWNQYQESDISLTSFISIPTGLNQEILDERLYYECTTDKNCAEKLIHLYAEKHQKDCNNDGKIDCYDIAAIHRVGPDSCNSGKFLSSQYWKDFNICYTTDRFSTTTQSTAATTTSITTMTTTPTSSQASSSSSSSSSSDSDSDSRGYSSSNNHR